MSDTVCAVCGKSMGLDVHEGEKRFHLDCYVTYKHRATPPALTTPPA
jgi:hypothetical protein